MKRRYFPGLNTLRLFAALSVIHSHLPGSSFSDVGGLFFLDGLNAVTLFFVLSGFLITYLLLEEHDRTGDVDVKGFYVRRILRIWPLYFFIIGLTALLLPTVMPLPVDLLAILLLSGQVTRILGYRSALGHLWSIGIEEWFYAVWPWVVKCRHLIFISVLVLCARPLIALLIAPSALWQQTPDGLAGLILELRFECMAIGGLGAVLCYRNHPLLKQIYRLEVPALLLFGLIILFADGYTGILFDDIASVVFMVMIVCLATKPRPRVSLEHRFLRYLGDRSYGLYLFHLPVLYLVEHEFESYAPTSLKTFTGNAALFVITVSVSLLLAICSYHYLETPFLRLKSRYRRVLVTASP